MEKLEKDLDNKDLTIGLKKLEQKVDAEKILTS